MKPYYVPAESLDNWRRLLADPVKHWRDGYSAKMLATRWWDSAGFPPEVMASLRASAIPLLGKLRFVTAFPEHKSDLPGGRRPSQTDIMVIGRADRELVILAVEGKAEEPFDELVGDWKRKDTEGKGARLAFLSERLGLAEHDLDGIRYQLLHRTESALRSAEDFAASHAVLLVHSFSTAATGFNDYTAFLQLFGLKAIKGTIQRAGSLHGIELYFSWTTYAL
ncbi:MAG: hypothetical protein ABSA47_18620 [Verrucomicrobiota bacterium]|jgi:hypothetical protein